MERGRAFQVFGSILIAYIIWSVLKNLFNNPVFSYIRIYICVACVFMILSSPGDSNSNAGTSRTVAFEEWVVDNNGNKIELFKHSKYFNYKYVGKIEGGNMYSSDEGELLFTEFLPNKSGGDSNKDGDWIVGIAILVLMGCILSLLIPGITGLISGEFDEAKSGTDEYYASELENQRKDSSENGQVSQQEIIAEGNYVAESDSLKDYGIFKDGRGISESDYIMPDSNTRKLTDADIDQLTLRGINYAKNEIYARHGKRFISQELQSFFDSRSWYSGHKEASTESNQDIRGGFNTYEKYNADLLYKHESTRGMYKLDRNTPIIH